jgi:hypothetical protein
MKYFGKLGFGIVACVLGVAASAADFDGTEALICSFARVVECDAGSDCRSVTNESVDAPDFVKLDFKKKKVIAIYDGVEGSPGDLDNVINLSNYLITQGVQGGAEGTSDTLAWSASIDHVSGLIVVSASGEKAAFVIFGACTPL